MPRAGRERCCQLIAIALQVPAIASAFFGEDVAARAKGASQAVHQGKNASDVKAEYQGRTVASHER